MNANDAAKRVIDKFPGRTATGYWMVDDGIIINTKYNEPGAYDGAAQFVVKFTGEIYGTNPMQYDISLENMKKL